MEVAAPFLPQSIATLISTVSLGARVSLRTAAIIVEALLETLQHGTSATLGVSRRSLLAAVSTAKILNVLKGNVGPNDAFSLLLDKYTNIGIYVIHSSFTLAELFTISGLQLASNTLTAGIKTAEESVRIVDGLFGSTETSRALAAVVGLVRKEVYEDEDFVLAKGGNLAVLAAITKAITVFACLQAATQKRTQDSVRAMLIYEGTVIAKTPGTVTALAITDRSSTPSGTEKDSGALLKDLSNVIQTDPDPLGGAGDNIDNVTQDMTTTQIEKVLSADFLQVTTTQVATTTTTQIFLRPGADLKKLSKPLPQVYGDQEHQEGYYTGRSHGGGGGSNGQHHNQRSSLEVNRATIRTARSRRGSVSSIASVQTTLTQYASTSIVGDSSNGRGHINTGPIHNGRNSSAISTTRHQQQPQPQPQAATTNNNLRLMFSTVTKKFKKQQKVQIGTEDDEHVMTRTVEREMRATENSSGLEGIDGFSEDDTDWIEVSSKSTESTRGTADIVYNVPTAEQISSSSTTTRTTMQTDYSSSSYHHHSSNPQQQQENQQGRLFAALGVGMVSRRFGRSLFGKLTTGGRQSEMTITEIEDEAKEKEAKQAADAAATAAAAAAAEEAESMLPPPPPPPPKEPKEPNPANFPRDHLVRNIQRFMRYSSASYGHNFMRILGIGSIGDAVYSPYGDHPNHHAFATHTSTPLDSILLSSFTDPATKSIFGAPKMHSLVHYINLDHGAQAVVLTCRGTLGLSDVLTDLCAHYDDLVIPNFELDPQGKEHQGETTYQVHAGMHASARLLSLPTSTVFQTIKKALEDYPTYGLVVCGHSLGGGVTALLAVLWAMKAKDFEAHVHHLNDRESDSEDEESSDEDEEQDPKAPRRKSNTLFTNGQSNGHGHHKNKRNGHHHDKKSNRKSFSKRRLRYPAITTPFVTSTESGLPAGRPIHCYAFGPPCIMALPLSRYCKGLVTTIVYQYDLVPTLSLGLLKDFKNVALTLHEEGQVVQDILKRIVMGAATSAKRAAAAKASSAGTSSSPSSAKKSASNEGGSSTEMDYDQWQMEASEDQDWSWALIKTMRADMKSEKLYPPSPVYLLESTATTLVTANHNNNNTVAATSELVIAKPVPIKGVAGRSSAAAAVAASSVPMKKSFSASAFSAASSIANGFRSTTPTPSKTFPPGYPRMEDCEDVDDHRRRSDNATPMSTTDEASFSSSRTTSSAQKAFKISMRKIEHVEDRFGELQFARTMFTDHSPANYEDCVERLCQAVFEPEEY